MEKIIFTLNNSDIHHDYTNMSFVIFEILLEKNHASVSRYINHLGCFDEKDFHTLNKRICLDAQPRVGMNEKHLLIFYAVIHYSCLAFIDKDDERILFSYMDETPDEFKGIRDKVHSFGDVVSEMFKRDYKHLKSFQILLKKIEGFA